VENAISREVSTRKFLHAQRGAAMAETAIVLVVVLVLFFGGIELGMMYHAQQVLSQAAAEGARFAAMYGGDTGEVRDRVEAQLAAGGLNADDVTVTVLGGGWGQPVTVQVEMAFDFAAPLLPFKSYVLAAQHSARCEQY